MKFIMKAILYVIMMNAVLIAGAVIIDSDFDFNPIFNLVVPVICAYASWEVEKGKARKRRTP